MGTVSTTVAAVIAVPRSTLFTWLVPGVFFDELESVLKDAAGLPGVARTTGTTGSWTVPGSHRRVRTTDGHSAREEVTAAIAPDYFSYRVTDFTHPLISRLVSQARGQWWFSDDPAGTRAVWTYQFDSTSSLAMPLLTPLIRVAWQRYMRAAIAAVKQRAERELTPSPIIWDFDLTALHGSQGMTEEDRKYQGSRYAEVRQALFANPYRAGTSGEGPGPLPMFRSTISNVWSGVFGRGAADHFKAASARSIDSRADLRWGADGKGYRRIISPNGICVLGTWEITEKTPYTGYFATGAKGLLIGRYSSDGNETMRGQRRSLSLAGKLYPTTDANHPTPLIPASFMAQEDLGGMRTPYINDAILRNEPNATAYRRGIYFLIMVRAGLVFTKLDKLPDARQLYEIAALGLPEGAPTRTPQYMELKMPTGTRRIAGADLDFREEIYRHLFRPGGRTPSGTIEFDISVSDTGRARGIPGFRRVSISDWRRIGRITFSEAVASYNGDHVIQFHHPGWREDRDDATMTIRADERRVR